MGPGEKVDFGAEVFAQAHRFIYFTEKKILGADYGMRLIVPIVAKNIEIKVADLHIDSDQSNIGFGDKQSGAAFFEELIEAGKPIGALCIAPVTVGMALKEKGPLMTVGKDENVIGALTTIGVKHRLCAVDDITVDEAHKIVTTPAYMIGPGIRDESMGIEKLVKKVLTLA